jgi:hypothetical protein
MGWADSAVHFGPLMPSRTRYKCLHCRELHFCDWRNRGRQHYCAKPECRKASKAASQKGWLAKEENKNYFLGSDNVERVRRWRADHPGYWRKKKPAQQDALQEICKKQSVVDEKDMPQKVAPALQDICSVQPALIVGLISVLTGHALQEDIAASARIFQSRGEDILRMVPEVLLTADYENQTHSMRPSPAACAAPI